MLKVALTQFLCFLAFMLPALAVTALILIPYYRNKRSSKNRKNSGDKDGNDSGCNCG